MGSYSRLLIEALRTSDPVPAEDYVFDCWEHLYLGVALYLLSVAKEDAGGEEIQDLSELVERLKRFILNYWPIGESVNEKRQKARVFLRRMKAEDPSVYPRSEYHFLAREILRIALAQVAQSKQR